MPKQFSPGRTLVALVGGLALCFLFVPILALIERVVESRGWEASSDTGIAEAITLSITTTLVTMLLTLLFGTPLAYVLARWRFPFKRALNTLIELPIVLPPAVAGLALLVTFGRRGVFGAALDDIGITLPFTTAAVIMAQTFVSAPFYVRAAVVGFQHVPHDLESAAQVDGATSWQVFRLITIPLAFRSLAAGLILSWARALGEFGATILFAGSLQGRTQTMPLLVYNVLERDINAALWTGVLMIGLALAALVASQWLAKSAEHSD